MYTGISRRITLATMGVMAAMAGTLVATVSAPTAVHASTPRPSFQLPFQCGESWRLTTYRGHDDYDIDFFANGGPTPGRVIVASAAGTVERSGWNGRYSDGSEAPPGTVGTAVGLGYYVIINHGGGWFTSYGHMVTWPAVTTGQTVTMGQHLGNVGKTGATQVEHLHYEQHDDTLDPSRTRGVLDKVESYFDGVPSGITSDGSVNTGPIYVDGPTSPAQYRTSNNCGQSGDSIGGVSGDFNRDGTSDIVARQPDGTLLVYPGTGTIATDSVVSSSVRIGSGWHTFTALTTGDFNHDGNSDIVARQPDGTLLVYPGTGTIAANAVVSAGVRIGSGWHTFTALTTGDFNHDGTSDIVARQADGTLLVYPGTGTIAANAVVSGSVRIGSGWHTFSGLTTGDFNHDGTSDIVARQPDGTLSVYPGTGTIAPNAVVSGSVRIGSGWHTFTALTAGDFNHNGTSDIVARQPGGTLVVYPGTGAIAPDSVVSASVRIGNGWNTFTYLT